VANKKIDILLSINYLFLIDRPLIALPELLAFNIHGSLLPKYRGRTPHVWAIINNEKVTGITAHLIDEGCDTGDIIEHIKINISDEDTGATLIKKYKAYYKTIVDKVLNNISKGKLSLIPQDERLATYFGKRKPDDGLINWDWQKERIRNWIRAQAHPYPGAYTYWQERKITIDRVSYSEAGFDFAFKNGTVLETSPSIIVKTPNGAISLDVVRENIQDFIRPGNILG
jgi:methionyl-tRNA formyltransferase